MRSQSELFEWKPIFEWKPNPVLPDLSRFHSLSLDTEYGVEGRKQTLAGISIKTPDGNKQYVPVGHDDGGNLDSDLVKRWLQREFRDKRIVGLNTGNDAEVIRGWGVDLEAQGNKLHDVAHTAALLNEYRRSGFNLNSIGLEYAKRGKTECPVDKNKIKERHSSCVGPYAEDDADLTFDIDEAQQPLIQAEDLGRVQDLEDRLIWVNNHIERSGARLDVNKLQRWRGECRADYSTVMMELSKSTSLPFDFKPNAPKKWAALFSNLGLPAHYAEEDGAESYDAAYLKTVKDPTVQLAFRAKKLASLMSKYLDKYAEGKSNRTGLRYLTGDILHFTLHQLRSDEEGTVSGRYSSADVNVQQVMQVKKQIKEIGPNWIIRELFVPDDGFDYFAGDASQIEFRLFAHYSGDRQLIARYNDDPLTDFYAAVSQLTEQTRDEAKITSLGKLYCMGIEKLAGWLGLPCNCGVGFDCACDLPNNSWKHDTFSCGRTKEAHRSNCPAIKAIEAAEQYDLKFPAAKKLSKKATKIAQTRKYVRTLLGRRARFGANSRGPHSALNRIIQGSAADIFKLKLCQLYENRNTVGIHKLRQPVHDEATGDCDRDPAMKALLKELFMETTIQLKVPLLWDVAFGSNWMEAKGK